MKKKYLNTIKSGFTQSTGRSYVAAIFAGLLLCSSATAQVANVSGINGPWTEKGLTEELTNARTRTSKMFVKDDKTTAAFMTPASIHFLSESNKWEEISTDILASSGPISATHPYSALTGQCVVF